MQRKVYSIGRNFLTLKELYWNSALYHTFPAAGNFIFAPVQVVSFALTHNTQHSTSVVHYTAQEQNLFLCEVSMYFASSSSTYMYVHNMAYIIVRTDNISKRVNKLSGKDQFLCKI